MKHTIVSEIRYRGQVLLLDLAAIALLLREGLTPLDVERLALVGDEHKLTIPELMRRALESEVIA
jgi:hypothetical protein